MCSEKNILNGGSVWTELCQYCMFLKKVMVFTIKKIATTRKSRTPCFVEKKNAAILNCGSKHVNFVICWSRISLFKCNSRSHWQDIKFSHCYTVLYIYFLAQHANLVILNISFSNNRSGFYCTLLICMSVNRSTYTTLINVAIV